MHRAAHQSRQPIVRVNSQKYYALPHRNSGSNASTSGEHKVSQTPTGHWMVSLSTVACSVLVCSFDVHFSRFLGFLSAPVCWFHTPVCGVEGDSGPPGDAACAASCCCTFGRSVSTSTCQQVGWPVCTLPVYVLSRHPGPQYTAVLQHLGLTQCRACRDPDRVVIQGNTSRQSQRWCGGYTAHVQGAESAAAAP